MASIFGFSIKNVTTFMGREGPGSQGNIYYNNKKVGWYNNSADGGEADINFDGDRAKRAEMENLLKEAARKYYERFPLTGEFACLNGDEQIFMEDLIEFTQDEKELKKHQKDGYIGMAKYQKIGEPYYEYTLLFKKGKAIEELQKRADIENVRIYTKDSFVITDEVPQIEGAVQETPPNMGM